jgi:hypothetical protein
VPSGFKRRDARRRRAGDAEELRSLGGGAIDADEQAQRDEQKA